MGIRIFVVIVGKQGWDYLIRDPARAPSAPVNPLKELTNDVEGLRFYRVVARALNSPDNELAGLGP